MIAAGDRVAQQMIRADELRDGRKERGQHRLDDDRDGEMPAREFFAVKLGFERDRQTSLLRDGRFRCGSRYRR